MGVTAQNPKRIVQETAKCAAKSGIGVMLTQLNKTLPIGRISGSAVCNSGLDGLSGILCLEAVLTCDVCFTPERRQLRRPGCHCHREYAAVSRPAGYQMTDGERPFKERLALQIVVRKIDSIFEECSKFEEKDKKILFEVLGNLLLQHMRQLPHARAAKTSTPIDETPPQIRELADTAPTDDVRQVLQSVADLCEAELEPKEDEVDTRETGSLE